MKMYITLLLIICISINTQNSLVQAKNSSQANEKKITIILAIPDNRLPLEFQLLITSLQEKNDSLQKQNEFIKILKELNSLLPQIPKESFTLLIKSNIYRTILENPPLTFQDAQLSSPITKESISLLNQKWRNNINLYNPFAEWLIESLQNDLWELSESKQGVKTAKMMRNTHDVKSQMSNREKLIFPWYQMVLKSSPEEYQAYLLPLMNHILSNILSECRFFLVVGHENSLTAKEKLAYSPFIFSESNVLPSPSQRPLTNYRQEKDDEVMKVLEQIGTQNKDSHGLPQTDSSNVASKKIQRTTPKPLSSSPTEDLGWEGQATQNSSP